MDRAEQLAALSGTAADQWGLVTAAQAKGLGLSAVQLLRLTEAGLLENVSRGVYLLSASGMPRYLDIKVAWLRLQPKKFAWERPAGHLDSGVVSHASACQLHELGDIPAPDVEITVPRRRTTTEPFVRLRTAPLDATEITVADGLPVTTVTRTIQDLLQANADGGHIGGVIAVAERRDLITLDDLAERIQPYARKYGLKANAFGRDLIDHLVAQAGESLRRQEVDKASQEGFDVAVRLLAEHPDLAGLLVQSTAGRPRTLKDTQNDIATQLRLAQPADLSRLLGATYPDVMELTGLRKALQDINRKLAMPNLALAEAVRKVSQPNPGLTEAMRKLNQPNPGLSEAIRKLAQHDPAGLRALRQVSALSPATRRALEQAASTAALPAHQSKKGGAPSGGNSPNPSDTESHEPERTDDSEQTS
ncbi:type IV toxin-antitoxin system AbiEi family antitoxin domain-containing protein [Streptomyces platensis]|uniref:type IV toxin-antitoxin system AbiEi family antitoxin domain-containing protein n=1 Tax=Streptomyces platensis TaxID=58346 RepID=UPI003C2D730C